MTRKVAKVRNKISGRLCLWAIALLYLNPTRPCAAQNQPYQSLTLDLTAVNAAVAAQLSQSNLFNSGFGFLDLTGGYFNLLNLLGVHLRLNVVPHLAQGSRELNAATDIVQLLEALRNQLDLRIPDVTNQNLNGDFVNLTVNQFIELLNGLNKIDRFFYSYYGGRQFDEVIAGQRFQINFAIIDRHRLTLDQDGIYELRQLIHLARLLIELAKLQNAGLNPNTEHTTNWY